jgi:hypothetical protein
VTDGVSADLHAASHLQHLVVVAAAAFSGVVVAAVCVAVAAALRSSTHRLQPGAAQ